MDNREARGIELASKKNIRKVGDKWRVPSSDREWQYWVDLTSQTCTCPDHEIRGVKCKHIFAAEFTVRRTTDKNGTVRETKTVRLTYAQNWTAYNAAQCEEQTQFTKLLADLCKDIPTPEQSNGRPRLPLADMVFASTYKVYSLFSARRFTSELHTAKESGLISVAPHFNSVSNYLSSPELTPILKRLITTSSLPLKAVETDFAVDSSGFGTSRFVKWFNKKYGREFDNREWVKVHLMTGVKTHTVTSVEISGWAANDTTYFKPLVEETAKHFKIAEVSADKAYTSHKNMDIVAGIGAVPYIPFKMNTAVPHEESTWAKMYYYFMLNREQFLQHYHKRSNVETVFSMVKSKFGDSVRSKSDTGMANEALCKVLCHNICVLNQALHEVDGLQTSFSNGVA